MGQRQYNVSSEVEWSILVMGHHEGRGGRLGEEEQEKREKEREQKRKRKTMISKINISQQNRLLSLSLFYSHTHTQLSRLYTGILLHHHQVLSFVSHCVQLCCPVRKGLLADTQAPHQHVMKHKTHKKEKQQCVNLVLVSVQTCTFLQITSIMSTCIMPLSFHLCLHTNFMLLLNCERYDGLSEQEAKPNQVCENTTAQTICSLLLIQ